KLRILESQLYTCTQ
uniref:Uncharacterized protein n=2 Tax=Jaculus jaculus TaxID=51337 RepID=A0A8C5K4M3_JACJA